MTASVKGLLTSLLIMASSCGLNQDKNAKELWIQCGVVETTFLIKDARLFRYENTYEAITEVPAWDDSTQIGFKMDDKSILIVQDFPDIAESGDRNFSVLEIDRIRGQLTTSIGTAKDLRFVRLEQCEKVGPKSISPQRPKF